MPWVARTCRNFTGWIQGVDPKLKNQIIVVQSYYDSTSVVPALAPGADTTCGLAAMLETMRYFKQIRMALPEGLTQVNTAPAD